MILTMRTLKLLPLTWAMLPLLGAGQKCPTTASTITVAGSSTVHPLSKSWAEGYTKVCTTTTLVVPDPEGSSVGARRVCGQNLEGTETAVEVGDMSRDWKSSEAVPTEGYKYKCAASDRKVIQIDVAIDGLTVAVLGGGAAEECIKKMGGLTVEQIRWIYSDLSFDALVSNGWPSTAVPNSDGDDTTHLWSELNSTCDASEILISGPDSLSGTLSSFTEHIFPSDAPDAIPFAGRNSSTGSIPYRNSPNDEDLVQYLQANPTAISFFGYAYAVLHSDLYPAPIFNGQEFVAPDATSILAGDYTPFARRIYMNVLDQPDVLVTMRPFFDYAFSDTGTQIVKQVGYVPIPEWEQEIMRTRLQIDGAPNLATVQCPTTTGSFSIAGSSTVKPITELWAGIFQVKCFEVAITVEGGGSSKGASRVCAVDSQLSPVDIGDMSRPFKDGEEATTLDGYQYQCAKGSTREVIQIEVAIDGLTVAVQRGGVADICIQKMGGLTIDQLRWIYSSFSEDQLKADGWTEAAVPNSDGNPQTHLWSELNKLCDASEIFISGADPLSGTFDYFAEIVLPGDDETFAPGRNSGPYVESAVDEVLVKYLVDTPGAISYFGYSYYKLNNVELISVPIKNDLGNFVSPNDISVEDGSYNPFSRRLYMNLLKDDASLELTAPFIEFGLSEIGGGLVHFTGYSNIPELEQYIMLTRAQTASGTPLTSITPHCGKNTGSILFAGSSTVFPIANLLGGVYEIGCDVELTVEGGGSSAGAERVCGGGDGPVDVGDMSRGWKDTEATRRPGDANIFDCKFGNGGRSVVQVPVAIDGLTVAAQAGSVAQKCIQLLGGLSLDQLRWLFSSYSEEKLSATEWKPSSLRNSDGDDTTHKWSELHPDCADVEAVISGADDLSGTQAYFVEVVFKDADSGEDFGRSRATGYYNSAFDEALVSFIKDNGNAISYFGYDYYYLNQDILYAAPIQNKDSIYVVPTESTVYNGSYNPLSRLIYMNLLYTPDSLSRTEPFMKFAFSDEGQKLVKLTGYVNLKPEDQDQILKNLASLASGGSGTSTSVSGPANSTSDGSSSAGTSSTSSEGLGTGATLGIVFAVLCGVVVLVVVFAQVMAGDKTVIELSGDGSPVASSQTNHQGIAV